MRLPSQDRQHRAAPMIDFGMVTSPTVIGELANTREFARVKPMTV
jgi:hypothetical protein